MNIFKLGQGDSGGVDNITYVRNTAGAKSHDVPSVFGTAVQPTGVQFSKLKTSEGIPKINSVSVEHFVVETGQERKKENAIAFVRNDATFIRPPGPVYLFAISAKRASQSPRE